MNIIWDKIFNKIWNETIPDSEIIRETEYKYPEFDINWADNNGWTSLIWTVIRNREELVRHFLTYPDLNINHKNYGGDTALYFACLYNCILILKLLLSRQDLDVNIQNVSEWTGLHSVCYYNRIRAVKELLLDARVDVLICDRSGLTARDIAIKRGHLGIANMLKMVQYTPLLRIPNRALCRDVVRMTIEEYT